MLVVSHAHFPIELKQALVRSALASICLLGAIRDESYSTYDKIENNCPKNNKSSDSVLFPKGVGCKFVV